MFRRALLAFALVCGCARPAPQQPRARGDDDLMIGRAVQLDGKHYGALRLVFRGNAHAKSAALARELTITHGLVDRELLDHDALVLAAYYYDRGYLDAKITSSVSVSSVVVTVTFVIDEGSTYRVRTLDAYEDLDGKRVAPLGWTPPFYKGELFRRDAFIHAVDAMRRTYRDLGYAYVEAVPETDYDKVAHEITVRIPVRRGPVTYFETIDIVGAQKLAIDLIKSECGVKVGDRYNETALLSAQQRLRDSAWFTRVDLATTKGTAPNLIKLLIEVEERPSTSHGEVALMQ